MVVLYSYGMLAACLAVLFQRIFRSFDRYRTQAVILFSGAFPPLIASGFRTFQVGTMSLDLAPIGFSLTGRGVGVAICNRASISIPSADLEPEHAARTRPFELWGP